jgi:hypothetical protein
MAKFTSTSYGALLVGPYDITGVTDKLEVSVEDPIVDTTPFGATLAQFSKPRLKKYTIEGDDGWYDDAASSIAAQAAAGLNATSQGFLFADRNNTIGAQCIMAQAVITAGWKRQFSVGEMTKANLDLTASGAVDEGKLILPYAGVTGLTGNSEATDVQWVTGQTPAGTNGGWGFLCVNSIVWGSATTLIVVMEDSADAVTYTTIGTTQGAFATINSGPTLVSEVKVMTGTIRQYIAAKWTFNGAGASANIGVGIYVNP